MQLGFEGTPLQAKCLSPQMDVSCVIRMRARDWNDFVSRLPSTVNIAAAGELCRVYGPGLESSQYKEGHFKERERESISKI